MTAALKEDKYNKFYDYEVDIVKGYFNDKLTVYFELVANPEFNQITVNRTNIVDSKMNIILEDNNIFV